MKDFFEKFRLEILLVFCSMSFVILGCISGVIYVMLVGEKNIPQFLENVPSQPVPVVMILPHQDDEMFMAGKFISLLERGHPAYAAIVTDGGNSHIRLDLQRQGYKDLDRQTFAHARNLEFVDSMKSLGIPPNHIFFMNPGNVKGSTDPRYQDGSLSDAQATGIIQQLYDKIGDGIYLTVAGGHSDHVVLEHALQHFSGITHKLFFPLEKTSDTQVFFLTPPLQAKKQEALHAYSIWKPEENRFAIGEHSVESLIGKWASSTTEYYFDSLTKP